MYKTKIICTLGPASESPDIIRKMILAGMNVARLNFSHGTHSDHKSKIEAIRQVSKEIGKPVAILQDLAGPKIRIGEIETGSVELESGAEFVLTNRDVPGSGKEVSINYDNLPDIVEPGDKVLLSDGTIELKVNETTGNDIRCNVITGGKLSSKKGINIPVHALDICCFTDKDKEDLAFGIENGVDLVAHSFVRTAGDIEEVKGYISGRRSTIPVIAKIENSEAIQNIDKILKVVDGIMVARGDLGVEIPIEKVPIVQKSLINKSNAIGKPVITATHMLKSMVHDPRPTRAEVTDVANAILDGTDAVMLSEETAIGDYPERAIKVLARTALNTETSHLFHSLIERFRNYKPHSNREALGLGVCNVADDMKASAIITYTKSGYTAKLVSRYRPVQVIIAVTPFVKTYRYLSSIWGVIPVLEENIEDKYLKPEKLIEIAHNAGVLEKGQNVVITDEVSMSIQRT
jgi:pyruvate kinase